MDRTVLRDAKLLLALSAMVFSGTTFLSGAERARADSAFELATGAVVDPKSGTVYLMNPNGGIDSVSVRTGERVWTTDKAAKPLELYGDLLIAQAESRGAATVEVVLLDVTEEGAPRQTFSIDLPADVSAAVDEGMGTLFSSRAWVGDGEPLFSWEYVERYVQGVAPGPDEVLQRQQQQAYQLDLRTQRATAVDTTLSSSRRPLPPQMEAWLESGVVAGETYTVGDLAVATQSFATPGQEQIVLKRWNAVTGAQLPDVTLFSRPHVLLFPAADERHLLVSERVSPGEFTEYEWTIFSLETGARLGQVSHHQSHAPFFVSDGSLIYLERPYGRLVGKEWVNEPQKLRAILLGSAAPVWELLLRDTAYRGEFPP